MSTAEQDRMDNLKLLRDMIVSAIRAAGNSRFSGIDRLQKPSEYVQHLSEIRQLLMSIVERLDGEIRVWEFPLALHHWLQAFSGESKVDVGVIFNMILSLVESPSDDASKDEEAE